MECKEMSHLWTDVAKFMKKNIEWDYQYKQQKLGNLLNIVTTFECGSNCWLSFDKLSVCR